jgi:sulfide:quinone oxidoreductase
MRVVVAGAGLAALEVIAGLHALAGERVDVTLLAPERSFSYRPLSVSAPYAFLDRRTRSLDELAAGLPATLVHDALAQVDEPRSRVLTRNGDFLPYDALVIAVGARRNYPGSGGGRSADPNIAFAEMLRKLQAGAARKVAFVVPREAAWPIDAYELALIASLARAPGTDAEIVLLTAENAPLAAFGVAAGEAVSAELARAGIELIVAAEPRLAERQEDAGRDAFSTMVQRLTSRRRQGPTAAALSLTLDASTTMAFDDALFLPATRGPSVAGTPHDDHGFVPIDDHGRVPGFDGLYAAGDATPLDLKHSTLASGQGTAVAEALAAAAGARIDPQPWSRVLHGFLTLPPRFPSPPGSPWVDDSEPASHCLWWPPGHVAGRHLAPYLAQGDPGIEPGLGWHPGGLPVAVEVEWRTYPGSPRAAAGVAEAALHRDAMVRQQLAVRRAEREGIALEKSLKRLGDEFEQHERQVIKQLRAAGYLREA